MKLSTLRCASALPVTMILAACGSTSPSQVQERATLENPAHVTAENAQVFIDEVDAVLNSSTSRGTIPVPAFLNIMPMKDDQRAILANAFPTPFAMSCDADDLCTLSADGRAVEATMDITLRGVSDPKLALQSHVAANLVRRADGVEFCYIEGMSARKFFVTRKVQGILMTLSGDNTTVVVNADDDEQNFTCE